MATPARTTMISDVDAAAATRTATPGATTDDSTRAVAPTTTIAPAAAPAPAAATKVVAAPRPRSVYPSTTMLPMPQLCVHEIFERAAQHHPTAVAIELIGDEPRIQVSYACLLHAASEVAMQLVSVGCPCCSLVGLLIPRCVSIIAGLLGVLRAGCAFVPMDPTYPLQRLLWMLEDIMTPVLLVTNESAVRTPHDFDGQLLNVDEICSTHRTADESSPPPPPPPLVWSQLEDLMYCIFTSGSTGRPKGVLIEHRAAVNVGIVFAQKLAVTPADRVFQFFSPSFDPSILDYMLALLTGARLLLYTGHFRNALIGSGATITGLTPSALGTLNPAHLAGFRVVMVGGEALPLPLARQWAARLPWLLNVYGPTEATIWATSAAVHEHDNAVSIGHPLPNYTCLVLNAARELAPLGERGELFIGGVGLARGYLRNPEMTAERFVAWRSGWRVYGTGDLASVTSASTIILHGRIDSQVTLGPYTGGQGLINVATIPTPCSQ